MVSRKSTLDHMHIESEVCKMSPIVHSRRVEGQNWVKFSPHIISKIQQTKMVVTCQRFGDLFLFGLV